MSDFKAFFRRVTSGHEPHPWQEELGEDASCRDRTVRVPTGLGKTAGVTITWLFHRAERQDAAWPRRLVFCLPMRVLVEQTERSIQSWLTNSGLDVPLHVLMGGRQSERWVEDIDRPTILVGTQDMLLSRALNRGYGSGRAMWPMEYGLLHQDALWVLDEVQLMDVGLATSAQLAAFREQDRQAGGPWLRPAYTWWMSATLQPSWLDTVDHPPSSEPVLSIPPERRKGELFDIRKPLFRQRDIAGAAAIARKTLEEHRPGTLSLVIVNRVDTAIDVFDALKGPKKKAGKSAKVVAPPEVRLVHSRFRGAEREEWPNAFLGREPGEPIPAAGRIIVATQVVEAGVDISAATLVTELAPWSSLVQRFGRAARYPKETANIIVVGAVPTEEKGAAPYDVHALAAADKAMDRLIAGGGDASLRALESFEDELRRSKDVLLSELYRYEPLHVLRRRDLDDLFDTSADLSGADLDVSRFIRSGEERDVTVFWRAGLEPQRGRIERIEPPRREELCPVPVGDLRASKLKTYVFDYLDGVWVPTSRVVPGMTLLLHAEDGWYSVERGWGKSKDAVPIVGSETSRTDPLVEASASAEGETLSVASQWKTIATHCWEAEQSARQLCTTLGLPQRLVRVMTLAGRWHDFGKGHQAFQDRIRRDTNPKVRDRVDLAKAPGEAWTTAPSGEATGSRSAKARRGFRHELASTLALFEVLHRRDPLHAALLGPHRELLEALGQAPELPAETIDGPLTDEIAGLSAEDFDLLAWLVCTHHGKVRCVWTSTPADQKDAQGGIHGVWEADALPSIDLCDAEGRTMVVPSVELSLASAAMGLNARYGASWGDRVAGLRSKYGPFVLTYLEAVLRIADWRASQLDTEDPRL